MKKLLFVAFLFSMCTSSYAQSDYQMYESIYLKPIPSKIEDFEKGMAAHNQEYHSTDPHKAGVWYAMTGKHGGQYAWVMGPTTFTHLDSRPADEAHSKDWNQNVLAYVEDISTTEYFRLIPELSYEPENAPFGKERWRVFTIKDGRGARFRKLQEKIVEVYKTYKLPMYRHTFVGVENGDNGRDFYTGHGFNNWADLDQNAQFRQKYEEINGANSWMAFAREIEDLVEEVEVELTEFLPKLSADR
jgi:hypothetical protein